MEEVLQGQGCSVQAGWRKDPVGHTLFCEECRPQRGAPAASQSLPSAASALVTAAQLPEPAAPTAVSCGGGGGEAPVGRPAAAGEPLAHAQACSCPEDDGHLSGPGVGACRGRRAVLAGAGALSSGPEPGLTAAGTTRGACNGGRGELARANGHAPAVVNGQEERGWEASVQPPPSLPEHAGKAWPGGKEPSAEGSKQRLGAAVKNGCRDAIPLGNGAGAGSPHSAAHGSTPTPRPGAMGGQRPTGPIAQGCGATAAASASSGLKPEPLRVTLLAAEDGFAPILAAARTGGLCGGCGATLPLQGGPYREGLARLKGQVAQLAGPRALTEPELVLVVGPALTLAGYPPLAVAQSEILHLGPAAALGRQAVDGAMHKFLRTEQRFGT